MHSGSAVGIYNFDPKANDATVKKWIDTNYVARRNTLLKKFLDTQKMKFYKSNGYVMINKKFHFIHEFVATQLKGELDGTTTELPGSANIEKGERVVLFAQVVEGRWYPTALQQSKYSVHETRLGLLLARKPLEADLYTRAPDGALEPIEEPPRKPIYTLDELRKTLAGLKE